MNRFPEVPTGNINLSSNTKRHYSNYINKLNEFIFFLDNLSLRIFTTNLLSNGLNDKNRHAICKNISALTFFINIFINIVTEKKSKINKNTAPSYLSYIRVKESLINLYDSMKLLNNNWKENIIKINELIKSSISLCTSYYNLEYIPK